MAAIQQIPTADPGLQFPQDYYGHKDCPTEWFWHIGTLEAADGRKFGFEINTANFSLFGFTQIEITDVQKQVNYQKVNVSGPPPKNWAQTDPKQPWYVTFEGPANDKTNGAVHMTSAEGNNPLHMLVATTFVDKSGTACELKLDLEQKGAPLKVWGTGSRVVDPKGISPLFRNNYYYSFTNLHTKGTIKIGEETIDVTGITWMDHEYGFFPTGKSGPVIWMLQDLQLENGMTLSNYTEFGTMPKLNVTMNSNATLLMPDGNSIFVDSKTTPMGPVFTSAKGVDYYMQFKVEIDCMQLQNATFIVQSLHPDQLFVEEGADVYEGVGQVWAFFGNSNTVSPGKAWIEQNLGK